MMKRLLLILLSSILVGSCSAPVGADFEPDGTLDPYYSQTIEWERCGGGMECATVLVPLDYNNLSGDFITLEVNRHRASNEAKRIGSLLINPGGPGGSGIDFAEAYELQFTPSIIERFDIVGWDPRGVSRSTPVTCFTDEERDELLASEATPDNAAEIKQFYAEDERATGFCVERAGEILGHVSTVETVKDLDILRAVVGDEKLFYLGKSYGTQIGALYAHLFPQNVGRLVLDGAVDVSLDSKQLSLEQAVGFETALDRFARYCLTAGKACDFGSTPEAVIERIKNLIESLDQNPLPTAQEGRVLTESLGWSAVFGPLYVPDGGWEWLLEALSYAFDGDGSGMLEIADWINGRELDGRYLDNSTEAFGAISCLDYGAQGAPTRDPLTHLAEFEKVAPTVGRVFAWGETGCADWPVDGEEYPRDVAAPSAAPSLVIGTLYDPATPDKWARALAANMQSGIYVQYQGDGHTAYASGSRCIDTLVEKYLITGTLPADGTSCKPDYDPLAN